MTSPETGRMVLVISLLFSFGFWYILAAVMVSGANISTGSNDVIFKKCEKSCLTCSNMVFEKSFTSSINGQQFDCVVLMQ